MHNKITLMNKYNGQILMNGKNAYLCIKNDANYDNKCIMLEDAHATQIKNGL